MKALVNPLELRVDGYRVCEVHETGFEVAEPLFWVECDTTVVADEYYFNTISNSIEFGTKHIATQPQPKTSGTQTL